MPAKPKKKRALALSGGGPVAGIEIGALKAFEKKNIDFDIYSCACVGSWVGCVYNSLDPNTDRVKYVEDFFRDKVFIPDDIYESFPINYKVFRMDYLHDYRKLMEKVLDVNTYKHLFLSQGIWDYIRRLSTDPPKNEDEYCYYISEGLSLNPFVRFLTELQYKVNKSGVAGLISSDGFVNRYVDFEKLKKTDKIVYINAYDITQKMLKIFINRNGHPKYNDIDADALMAGSSVLHYTENRTIDGKKYKYCEGAVIDTVNLDILLTDHSDLDEIWVVKIADYKEVKPPKNLIESSLLSVMLPFNTISDDDIELFSHKLEEHNQKNKKIDFIDIPMNYGKVNYNWNHSNLNEGINVGYNGTLMAIDEYEKKQP